jgi:hypothetical protein
MDKGGPADGSMLAESACMTKIMTATMVKPIIDAKALGYVFV